MSTQPGKVFLFGVSSMLGWSLARAARHLDIELFCNVQTRAPGGANWRRLNLQHEDTVRALLEREHPAMILHCAGICDVERCESAPAFAHEVNVRSMESLLRHVSRATRIVYLSSDHVFSGDTGPYTESSLPDPISVYGRTRMLAEALLRDARPDALIVRAGLWIGPSHNGRLGHLDWLRYRTAQNLPMTVVADEHRSAVWAEDAALRVLALARSPVTGVRHVVARRIVDRPSLAAHLNERFGIGASFSVQRRADRRVPHLGAVDLCTEHTGDLAAPLAPVVP